MVWGSSFAGAVGDIDVNGNTETDTLTLLSDEIELGNGSDISGTGNVGIGRNTSDSGVSDTVVIGDGAFTNRARSTIVGARSGSNFALGATAVGSGITALNNNTVAVGAGSGGGAAAVAIGERAFAGPDSISIGQTTSVSTQGVSRMGADQFVFSGVRDTISDADLNTNELTVELDEANSAFRLRGKDSTGTVQEATVPF
jgi:hypothetical protein